MSLGNPLPGDGSSIDYVRHTLSKGLCRTGAPLTGRSGFAHGEFKEPAFAGLRLRAVVPLQDPTAVTIRVIPSARPQHRVSITVPQLGRALLSDG